MTKTHAEPTRCEWCAGEQLYLDYHDHEWGRPVTTAERLFEFLILEGAQAGLSWITILKRRERYRQALAGFSAAKMAGFGIQETNTLLANPGIIRNKLKIKSAINNARKFLDVEAAFTGGFSALIWSFVDGQPLQNHWLSHSQLPAQSSQSKAMAKELKSRGFSFVGPTICYAYMQACGLVNDHITSCYCYKECYDLRNVQFEHR